jgi:hypothetical protein
MTLFSKSSKNEKILLSILVGILFVGGNYFGYRWLSQKQTTLTLDYAQLRADQEEARVDLKESDLWAQRKAWINDHEPSLADEGETKAAVLNYVVKGAKDNKLEVTDQSLSDVQHGAAGARVNVKIAVKGSMHDLCNWLADLQKPDQFYAVTSFSLKADQDQKSMVCTLQIARYFKGGS